MDFILNNPLIAAIIASPVGLMMFFAGFKIAINILFSEKNINKLGDYIDNMVDKAQKKDPAAGKLLRKKLIELFERIIKDLKEADGIN